MVHSILDRIDPDNRIRNVIKAAVTPAERIDPKASRAAGKKLRDRLPRESMGEFAVAEHRPHPVDLIREQGKNRVQDLLPLRYERMGVSAFTFYRGAALIMAQDLSYTPNTGIDVQLCGDAHVSNFGLFASPERRLVFDLNDFDETSRGPWEWDVKRLVASLEICGRDRGFSTEDKRRAVLAAASTYRTAMREFAKRGNMDVFYAHIDIDELVHKLSSGDVLPTLSAQKFEKELSGEFSKADQKALRKTIKKAKLKDNSRAIVKLTEEVDGQVRIVSNPPVLVPLRDAPESMQAFSKKLGYSSTADAVSHILSEYRMTLDPSHRHLLDQYRGVDIAHKVVGVGSVGTRAWIVVMEGSNSNDYLVLQIKEAQESVIERFCGKSSYLEHGHRVVSGQRAIQAAGDPFLGWCRLPDVDGGKRDYYVRQLWDGKGSADLDRISPAGLVALSGACGWTLARAHARTGDRFAIGSYLGKKDVFDQAMYDFAVAYANQNELDYQRFIAARDGGEL